MNKKYTVKARSFKKYDHGKSMFDVTIFVDKETDIPEPLGEWAVGSMCIIGNSHDYRWLNHERNWV